MLTVTKTEATPSVAPRIRACAGNDREADIVTSVTPRALAGRQARRCYASGALVGSQKSTVKSNRTSRQPCRWSLIDIRKGKDPS
jgi:hypothetical protein